MASIIDTSYEDRLLEMSTMMKDGYNSTRLSMRKTDAQKINELDTVFGFKDGELRIIKSNFHGPAISFKDYMVVYAMSALRKTGITYFDDAAIFDIVETIKEVVLKHITQESKNAEISDNL